MTFAHLTVVWLLLALCYVQSVVLSQSASAVFAVTGFLSGVDFVVEYSFQATSTLLVGPVGDVNAVYLVSTGRPQSLAFPPPVRLERVKHCNVRYL